MAGVCERAVPDDHAPDGAESPEPGTAAPGDAAEPRGPALRSAATGSGRQVTASIMDLISTNITEADAGQSALLDLQSRRRELQDLKRTVSQQLRNERRKRTRMLHRSARLSSEDLVEILQIRQVRAQAKAKAAPTPPDSGGPQTVHP